MENLVLFTDTTELPNERVQFSWLGFAVIANLSLVKHKCLEPLFPPARASRE